MIFFVFSLADLNWNKSKPDDNGENKSESTTNLITSTSTTTITTTYTSASSFYVYFKTLPLIRRA